MPFVPVMWAIWGALVLLFFFLKIYVSRLSRDEDDQIILQESFAHVKQEQAAILAKVRKFQPIEHAVLWILGAMSLFVAGYYVLDVIRQFQ